MKKATAEWNYGTDLNPDVLQDWRESTRLQVENMSEHELFDEEGTTQDSDIASEVFIEHMDIREPISVLRDLLAGKVTISLDRFTVWLQNTTQLSLSKNIADQCIQGEGLVQINCQIDPAAKKINIVDILKPSDDVLAHSFSSPSDSKSSRRANTQSEASKRSHDASNSTMKGANKNWAIDNAFKRDQIRLGIADNPMDWTKAHVKFWLNWARKQFSQASIEPDDWNMTGEELCNITMLEFNQMVPTDPGNFFWTHLELLRKCKYVAVQQNGGPPPMALLNNSNRKDKVARIAPVASPQQQHPQIKQEQSQHAAPQRVTKADFNHSIISGADDSTKELKISIKQDRSNRSGTNGQIQLWQFLLEILTDASHRDIIQWQGEDGEFKLVDAERVAQLWGERKNKPNMNYEKLSRALRYYYDGDMLAKMTGKRFVYKFICDLQQLVGYKAADLARLVAEQEEQS